MFIPSSRVSDQLCAFSNENSLLAAGDSVDMSGLLALIRGSLLSLQSRDMLTKPDAGAAVVDMIASYNAYITYRAPAYQLLFPIVSFLRTFHAAMLATPDTDFLSDLIEVQCAAMLQEEVL